MNETHQSNGECINLDLVRPFPNVPGGSDESPAFIARRSSVFPRRVADRPSGVGWWRPWLTGSLNALRFWATLVPPARTLAGDDEREERRQ